MLLASRLDADLTATLALVLIQVATWASGCAGACWASVASIATAAHVSERTAQRSLRELVARGWLVELREVGRSTVYRVRVERVREPRVHPGGVDGAPASVERAQLDLFGGGVSQWHPGGDTVSPDQTTDQTIQGTPPSPPAPAGGNPTDDERPLGEQLDPLELLDWLAARTDDRGMPIDERSAVVEPPELRLDRAREVVEALVEPMLGDLDALPPAEVDRALDHYRAAPAWLVDRWVAATRGRRTVEGLRRDVVAPDGVRRRYVIAALRAARTRYLGRSQ